MKSKHYAQDEAFGLLPLLGSIGREIEERTAALRAIEGEIESLDQTPATGPERQGLIAQAAGHRRELRLARAELDQLGCSVVGTSPLTFCIPGKVNGSTRSFVWQTGDPVLK